MKRSLCTIIKCVLLFALLPNLLISQCLTGGRYYDKLFQVKSNLNIQYGTGLTFNATYQDLYMNVYEPLNDTLTPQRPLIVLAFGGSFTSGFKTSPDIVRLCNEFTQRGYVTCAIDYRLGFENGNDSDTNQFKALIRGVQDMKASVRYFYKDAQTAKTYRVDTNKIFIGGVSAGAFIALNYAYGRLDTLSFPAPGFALPALLSLGGPEGDSGNPGYSSKVSGVINLCGAIADTVWIMPSAPPLCGVHGTNDSLVACQFDSAHAAQTVESRLFGGCDIVHRLQHINTSSSFHIFQGAGHVPFVLPSGPSTPPSSYYMDTTIWVIRDFLYRQVCYQALAVEAVKEGLSISVYPNPSSDFVNFSSQQNSPLQLEIFGVDGRLMAQNSIEANETITLSKQQIGAGVYIYKLTDVDLGTNKVGRLVFY